MRFTHKSASHINAHAQYLFLRRNLNLMRTDWPNGSFDIRFQRETFFFLGCLELPT